MINKIKFSNEAASALVRERIKSIDAKVEVIDEKNNGDHFFFKLQLTPKKSNILKLSKELLSDLFGKYTDHLYPKLDQKINDALNG